MFNQQPTSGMGQPGGMPFPTPAGNRWSGAFPMGRALPARPNPLARALPVQQTKADIGGIQQAMAKRGAESCDYASMKRSPAGEGNMKYKVDKDADSKGEEAFKSLDNYMKKAGLNSFQANFFGRLIQHGMDESAIREAVKQANDRFGVKVASELNEGLNKLAFAALGQLASRALPALSRAGKGIVNFGKGIGGAKNVNKGLDAFPEAMAGIQNAKSPAFMAGKSLNQGINNVFQQAKDKPFDAVKNVFTGTGARQGAISGALNPYTGLMSGNAFDDDGSVNWTGLAGSTLAGTLGGRALGRIGGNVANVGNRMQQQMLAGSGFGGTAGMIGGMAGVPGLDFQTGAQLGGLAGFAPNRLAKIPGLQQIAANPNTPPIIRKRLMESTSTALNNMDPVNVAFRKAAPFAQNAYQTAKGAYKANPDQFIRNVGLGAGAAGLGYGALQVPGAIQSGIENAGQNMLQSPEVQNRLRSMDSLLNEGRSALAQGRETMGNVNSAVKPFVGENGQSNWLGGLLSALGGGGQVGKFIQDNQQWLIPGLMSGLGAGGGYALGGGGGAALGGIGLPLLYALANQGNMGGGGLQQRSVENASALAMPNEIERQKAQQQADQQEAVSRSNSNIMLGPGGRLGYPAPTYS